MTFVGTRTVTFSEYVDEMQVSSRLRRGGCALAVFMILACGDGTAPELSLGTYVLRTVGGDPVPVTYYHDADGTHARLLADTITLLGRGRAASTFVLEVTGSPYRGDTVAVMRSETNYRLTGSKIEVGIFDCPINALCAGPRVGELEPHGFTLSALRDGQPSVGIYTLLP